MKPWSDLDAISLLSPSARERVNRNFLVAITCSLVDGNLLLAGRDGVKRWDDAIVRAGTEPWYVAGTSTS